LQVVRELCLILRGPRPAARDLLVTATVVSGFMLMEGRRLRMRLPLLYIGFGYVLAMAFTIPLSLLVRQRTLAPTTTRRRRSRELAEGDADAGTRMLSAWVSNDEHEADSIMELTTTSGPGQWL